MVSSPATTSCIGSFGFDCDLRRLVGVGFLVCSFLAGLVALGFRDLPLRLTGDVSASLKGILTVLLIGCDPVEGSAWTVTLIRHGLPPSAFLVSRTIDLVGDEWMLDDLGARAPLRPRLGRTGEQSSAKMDRGSGEDSTLMVLGDV